MQEQLDLIKRFRTELEQLQAKYEIAYHTNHENLKELEKIEKEIKDLTTSISQKENKKNIIEAKIFFVIFTIIASICILWSASIPYMILLIAGIGIITLTFLLIKPNGEEKINNIFLKLSSKVNKLERQIRKEKKKLKEKEDYKQILEERKEELSDSLNTIELNIKYKDTELRNIQGIYFDTLLNQEKKIEKQILPHQDIIKTRIKKK